MKNQLYLILVLEGKTSAGLSNWQVLAADSCYFRMREQYGATHADGKMLLTWTIIDGIRLLRINHGAIQFTEQLDTVHLPFMAIPAADRAGLHTPVYDAVLNFLKD